MGWTPSRLSDSRPGASEKVIDNLLGVGSCLGLAIESVLLWMPQVDEIRAIATALDIGTRSDVVNAIVHSLDKSAKPLGSPKQGHEPSLDFVESRRRLQKELLSPGSSSKRRQRKVRQFQRTVEAVLVDPLHERAAAEPSLSERSRLAALAEANRTTHLRAAVCLARMEKEISEKGLRAQYNEAEIRGVLKSLQAVEKLIKARR